MTILLQKQRNSFSSKLGRSLALCVAMAAIALVLPSFAQAQAPSGPKHQVTASWTAAAGATGYNVYKCPGTCTSTSGTFSVLTVSAPVTGTSFVDTAVVQGQTYTYCATSLATLSTGPFESACSAITAAATGTIPKDPTVAPTGFSVVAQ